MLMIQGQILVSTMILVSLDKQARNQGSLVLELDISIKDIFQGTV